MRLLMLLPDMTASTTLHGRDNFDDTMIGTECNDKFLGRRGIESINAGGENDGIDGGKGVDFAL